MAVSTTAKAATFLLSDERGRKVMRNTVITIISPLALVVVLFSVMLSGSAELISAVEKLFG